MRAFLLAVIAVATGSSFVAAQGVDLSNLSPCVMGCVSPALGSVKDCKQGDIPCYCKKDSFISGISTCVRSKCTQADVDYAATFASSLCTKAGVSINTGSSLPTSTAEASTYPTEIKTTAAPSATAHGNGTTGGGNHTATTAVTSTKPAQTTGAASALAVGGLSMVGGAIAALLFL